MNVQADEVNMCKHFKRQRATRAEYLAHPAQFARRGEDCNHRITTSQARAIKQAIAEREKLRLYITENLTNEALAKRFKIHRRTVDRISESRGWVHV